MTGEEVKKVKNTFKMQLSSLGICSCVVEFIIDKIVALPSKKDSKKLSST